LTLEPKSTLSTDTFDHIGAPSIQKCDEVARVYNGQTATFLGNGCGVQTS